MLGGFIAHTAEYHGLVVGCKKENTVITIVVVSITTKEIQEPSVLERTSPDVIIKAPRVGVDLAPRGTGTRSRQCWVSSSPSLLNAS